MTENDKGRSPRQGAAPNAKRNDGDYFSTGCSPIDRLLSRLEKVRPTGPSRWIALCPSHGDKHPSLAIREADDGTILIKCHAGCSAYEIVSAVEMELHDLFPWRSPDDHVRHPEHKPFPASDILRCIKSESMILASIGVSMLDGRFTENDRERLIGAVSRIQAAATMGGC
jgi:hypothetical protein